MSFPMRSALVTQVKPASPSKTDRRGAPLMADVLTSKTVDHALQRGLVLVYLLCAAAGLACLYAAPPSMLEVIGEPWSAAWGVFMLLGGGACFIGSLVRRGATGDWFGEYVGLWAVIAGVGLYGAIAAATLDDTPGRSAGVLLLWAFAALLVVRWFRVRDDAHQAAQSPTTSRT